MTGTVSALISRQDNTFQWEGTPYSQALHMFWAGDSQGALDRLSQSLADDPEVGEQFALYRLWLEILAQDGDRSSLVRLGEHLFLRGQADPECHHSYMALRALVHLELDEFDGARLLAETVVDFVEDAYCMEVNSRIAYRCGDDQASHFLLACTDPIQDFFVWQSLTQFLLVEGNPGALSETLAFVDRMFVGAMLTSQFEFHRLFEEGNFGQAVQVAQRLHDRYPQRGDYAFNLGYALFKADDFRQAIVAFNAAMPYVGDQDIDVLKLLGMCHEHLGEHDKSRHYLMTAHAIAAENGMPTTDMAAFSANSKHGQNSGHAQPTRMWLIKLSPRRYADLVGCRRGDVESITRAMGKEPRKGDMCFFAAQSSSANGQGKWRIIAIYSVASDPVWHPVDGYQSVLKLVDRPAVGISVDVRDTSAGASSQYHERAKDGIYELEVSALDIITDAVRRHADGDVSREAEISVKSA